MDLELHQLELRHADLRIDDPVRRRRLTASLAELGQPVTPETCTPTCEDADLSTIDTLVATETIRNSFCVHDVIPCSTTDPCTPAVCNPNFGCVQPKDCGSYPAAPSPDGTSFLRYAECHDPGAGLCRFNEPCNDDDPCTHDTQDPDGQCRHVPKLCDENGNCTTSDGQGAPRPQCRIPDDPCTTDTCDVDGRCVEIPVFCEIQGPCGEQPLCDPALGGCWVPLTTDPRECRCDAPRDDCSVAHVATPRIAPGVGTYYACDKEVARTCDEAGNCTCDGVPCTSLCRDREGWRALLDSGGCLASSSPVWFEERFGSSQHCRGTQCVTEACNDGDACTEDCGPCEGVYTALYPGVSELEGPFLTCLAAKIGLPSFEPVCNPSPLDCDDHDPCTDDTCAPSGCEHTPRRCDDGNACTDDSCNAAGECSHADNTASCDDGIACTENDTCRNGTCSGGRYSWSGLLQPINADGSSVFKRGSTVPVKFRLTGSCAGTASVSAQILLAKVSNQVVGSEQEAASTSAADAGNAFRYDPRAHGLASLHDCIAPSPRE